MCSSDLITPMREDGSVHYEQFQRLIDWHVENGTDAIVAVGTTGESTTLSVPEKIEVIEAAIRFADGRIPVIAGTGVNSTSEAIELSRAAVGSGAYATLSVVPYYNKPPQEGIYRHFAAIAEAADIPMIVYNVPGRTVVNMNNDTVLRLAEIPNIIGIKEASGDIGRMVDLVNRVHSSPSSPNSAENLALYTKNTASHTKKPIKRRKSRYTSPFPIPITGAATMNPIVEKISETAILAVTINVRRIAH